MNIDDILPAPPFDPVEDTSPYDDMALNFVEEEVGRYDWDNNWRKLKDDGLAEKRVKDWMTFYRVPGQVSDIFDRVELLVKNHSGSKWK